MKLRFKLILVTVLVTLICILLYRCDSSKTSVGNTLQPGDKEKIVYNSHTHTITVQTDKGTTITEYGRNPTVTLRENGDVVVQRHDWGFEHDPYVGFGLSDVPRVHIGVSLFYYNRWDLNLGLALTTRSEYAINDWVRGCAIVSYNVWSNTNLFVGVDNKMSPTGGFFLRW